MTETNEPGTSLERVISAGILARQRPGATVADVLAAMFDAEVQKAFAGKIEAPKKITITPEQHAALATFASRALEAPIPSTVTELDEAQKAAITRLRQDYDLVNAVLTLTEKSMKQAVHNHFDLVAEEKDLVDEATPRNKDGHYVLKDTESMAVDGVDEKWVRETSRGATSFGPNVESGDLLKKAVADGKISHDTYKRWTKQTRVVNREAIFKDMADPELLPIIKDLVQAEKASCSVRLRDNDGVASELPQAS